MNLPQRTKQILQVVLFLGLGVALACFSWAQIPADKMESFSLAIKNARFWLFIPVFFVLSASHWLRAYRWKLLIQSLQYRPSLLNTFFAVMIGYLANLAVPRLGEVLKCTLLAKYEKVPADKLIGTIVVERAFDVICLLVVFILALVFQFKIVYQFMQKFLFQPIAGKWQTMNFSQTLVLLVAVVIIFFILFYVFKKYLKNSLVTKTTAIFVNIGKGITSVKTLQNPMGFILSTLGIWVLYVLGTFVGFYATQGTAHLGLPVAFTALAFGSVGMIVTPGGIGAYAIFLALAMQENGISYELGYANGTLQWFAQFLVVLVVGVLSAAFLPIINKKHETQ